MLYQLRKQIRTRRFEWITRGIRATPPVRLVAAPWTFVSMVGDDDVQLYLLAMKTLYRRLQRGNVVAIVAKTMPQPQRDLLAEHFQGIHIEALEAIDTGRCQRGGTWERLVHILDRARDGYVIQVDSDTLAIGRELDEVAYCAANNLPFTLSDGWPLVTMRAAAEAARAIPGAQPGIVAERAFDRYPNCDRLLYVRGSSGFTGFAKGAFSRDRLEEFDAIMSRLTGAGWRGWGTEQCASNFAIANSPRPVVLPFPAYACFFPGGPRAEAKFLHFIGSHRFDEDFYGQHALAAIADLAGAPAPEHAVRTPTQVAG